MPRQLPFVAPHVDGHIFGCNVFGVPVDKQNIAPLVVPLTSYSPPVVYMVAFRIRQMRFDKYVTTYDLRAVFAFNDGTPIAVFVVGHIYRLGRPPEDRELGRLSDACSRVVVSARERPVVHDITDGLQLVGDAPKAAAGRGETVAAVYLDALVVALVVLLAHVGQGIA